MNRLELQGRQKQLKRYLEKISPEVYDSPGTALEGLESNDAEHGRLNMGLEKLASGQEMSFSETQGLEAIIHKKFRPALFVINDRFNAPSHPWSHFNEDSIRATIEEAIPLIGRIELPAESGIPFGGTGFVVGKGLIMTNRHVAELFARGVGTNGLRLKPGMSAGINLRREVIPTPEVVDLEVVRIVMIHPFWDMALLQVNGLPEDRWLKLSTQHTEDLIGRDIAVIGYPAQDRRNDMDLQNEIFGGVYNVKRLQPGKLDPQRRISSFGNAVDAATHDASTLGGNSGSAVIDVQSGKILALHFAGLYLDANFAVPTAELARDQRVVDSGVCFDGSVDSDAPWTHRWASADNLKEQSAAAPVSKSVQANSAQTSMQASAGKPGSVTPVGNTQVSITIPLTITVSLGNSTHEQDTIVQAAAPIKRSHLLELSDSEEESIIDRAYDRASSTLLQQDGYASTAALSAAAASSLVYSNNEANLEQTCRQEFDFDSCKFFKKGNTECFVASTSNTILVCFRGTRGLADWIANMNVSEQATQFGMVHSGFLNGFLDVQSTIESTIDALQTSDQKLVLTGHSLGGALSTIAASLWRDRYEIRSVYTFGQPAVGDREFSDGMQFIKERFFRVVNDDDIVARIPPGFKHVGKRIKLPANRKLDSIGIESAPAPETSPAESMLTETEFHELQQRFESSAHEGIFPSFGDHKIANYLYKLLKLSSIA